ncbi:hypothetical protein PTKU64_05100 [Paraburkholderia terrae]|uniref:Uncharacterized protein n=1 Tax=Paraburkholderia terrae TaxID=311230 RepID=A0ABM7TDD5_9BURK|nr:hypothetical protein PTKU64_05100 [Paraburkholderia terrae]
MIQLEFPIRPFDRIRFDERIGRAAYAARVSERAQRGAHERRFAGAQVAVQLHLETVESVMDRRAGFAAHAVDRMREALAECHRRGFVRERKLALEQDSGGRSIRGTGVIGHSRKMT